MEAIRQEIRDELVRVRLDKVRLYNLLEKIVDAIPAEAPAPVAPAPVRTPTPAPVAPAPVRTPTPAPVPVPVAEPVKEEVPVPVAEPVKEEVKPKAKTVKKKTTTRSTTKKE